jgi:hypothetical protein
MYDHYYIIGELQKQRACEIKKQVRESRLGYKKPLMSFFPNLKHTKQNGH